MHNAAGIQVKRRLDGALAVFCKDTVIRQLAWSPTDFDASSRPEPILLLTGAKAYRHGNGWWTISGYASDRSDVRSVEDRVTDLLTNLA